MNTTIPVLDPLNGAVSPDRGGGRPPRRRGTTCALLALLAALAGGCGTVANAPSAHHPQSPAPSRWPTAADYTTIKIAAAVRNHALFHETDWRRRSQAAALALRTMLTVRIAAGPCAAYVTQLYGDLRGLLDAYPGEDWRPLVRVVHREPSLASSCRTARSTASDISSTTA